MSRVIIIRPISFEDGPAFTSSAQRSRGLHRPWINAPCDAVSFESYFSRFDGQHNLGYVVIHEPTGQLIGAINLTNVVYGLFRSGYISYFAFEGFNGKGYMKRGLSMMTRYAFRTLRLHRLEANIQPSNLASIALVSACGFLKEGYSPAYLKIGGKWRDHERWALVRGIGVSAKPQGKAEQLKQSSRAAQLKRTDCPLI